MISKVRIQILDVFILRPHGDDLASGENTFWESHSEWDVSECALVSGDVATPHVRDLVEVIERVQLKVWRRASEELVEDEAFPVLLDVSL